MKIALPTTEEGRVDDHFGHCRFHTIVTADRDGRIIARETMPSPQGCGCKSGVAPLLRRQGVTLLLAGNMGQGACDVLARNGIAVIRGCSGPVEEVVAAYLAGRLQDSGDVCHHHDAHGHDCAADAADGASGWRLD